MSKYDARGVSAQKEDVHRAIKNLDKGLYPNAFCKVLPDYLGADPDMCNVMHADGAGTKSVIAYMMWKETGDIRYWRGIAQDAIVMNLDDLICVGITDNILISSTIGRNKSLIPGEVISEIINATAEFIEKLRPYGINMYLTGGETADVGDIVRTIIVDITASARTSRSRIIEVNIQPGDVIVGLASYGQAVYEDDYNSGIGSNGLTSARHDILNSRVKENYPETYDPLIPDDLIYTGKHFLTDIEPHTGKMYGDLLLSPTRTYAPIIKTLLEEADLSSIHGIIHCSGGAQTKVLKFTDRLHIIKDNLLPIPPLFRIIQQDTGTPWKEMFQVFNMGHRMEIYTDEKTAEKIITIAQNFGVDAAIIGHTEKSDRNRLTISNELFGKIEY